MANLRRFAPNLGNESVKRCFRNFLKIIILKFVLRVACSVPKIRNTKHGIQRVKSTKNRVFVRLLFLLLIFFLSSCANTPKRDGELTLEAKEVSGWIFEISAKEKWGNTKIKVNKSQEIQLSYIAGRITDNDTAASDANGTGYVCGNSNCCEPLPSVPRMALIGRVGEEIFYIGNGGVLEMPATGHLYLRLNDCDEGLYDNNGELSIIIFPEQSIK